MKKILYVIPMLVFAMVGLSQDVKAQSGQVGNASNAITQGATNAVIGSALTNTGSGNNNQGGGSTVGVTVTPNAPVPVPPVVVVANNVIPMSIPDFGAPSFPPSPTLIITTTIQFVQVAGISFSIPRLIIISTL